MIRILILLVSTVLGVVNAYIFLQTKEISTGIVAILNFQIALLAKETVQNIQVLQFSSIKKLYDHLKKSKNEEKEDQ